MFVVCLEDNLKNFTGDKIYQVLNTKDNTKDNEYEIESDNNIKTWVSNRYFAQIDFIDYK